MPAVSRALIFDLDGTLYRQKPVQRGMMLRLAAEAVLHPLATRRTVGALQAFRKAQESLRDTAPTWRDLAEAQLEWAAQRSGCDPGFIRAAVSRWMEEAPLDLIRSAMRPGLPDMLRAARESGCRLGLLSDYPADRKLDALGVRGQFDVVACAQDPDIQRFKPDPRGIELVRERLGVSRALTVYVGDREEVDGVAAERAGVRCLILRPAANWSAVLQLLDPPVPDSSN